MVCNLYVADSPVIQKMDMFYAFFIEGFIANSSVDVETLTRWAPDPVISGVMGPV